MDQDQKHYYAFISHSSADEKIALWLRNQLENYHIPSAIQRDYHAPKQLKPIFVYQTDLAGIKLKEALDQSLADSKYLIVICSPDAAKSEYVNGEVQHFIDTGRADKIMPFIISGTPYASLKGNIAEECFPPALVSLKNTDAEQRGVNLPEAEKKMGDKKAAVVNVIASMLGVRMDVLWDRYRRRKIRQRTITAGLVLLFCLIGTFLWDYNRPIYRYYADYVDKWGVPEGVIELTKEQQRHRNRMYQFEYRRIPFGEPNAYAWRVVKVSYVNSYKQVHEINHTELTDRYPIQQIEYNKNTGDVARLAFCNTKDKVLLRHVLSERNGQKACIADFIDSQEQRGAGFVGANLSSMSIRQMDKNQQKSNIVRFVYERDSNGYIVRQTYHANNDYNLSRSAVPDGEGIFGQVLILDSLGRRVKIDYIGINSERTCTQKGIAGKRYEYDQYGNMHIGTYVDLHDNPILNEKLWAVCIDISDEWGNVSEESLYGTKGQPCLSSDGFAKCVVKYDIHGNRIDYSLFGIDGEACIGKDGYSQAINKFDTHGNCIEVLLLDNKGRPCFSNDGDAKVTLKYDKKGNAIERRSYDTNGKPCMNKYGFATEVHKYDTKGNCIEYTYLDIDNKPCFHIDGCAKVSVVYDDRGNVSEMEYFGTDGQPCLINDGYARFKSIYDERGNVIEWTVLGTDGQTCLCNDGYAKSIHIYDDNGNNVETTYYGTNGKQCLHKDGYAKKIRNFDERGNLTEITFFGIDNHPCLVNNGYAKVLFNYDAHGNNIEASYYGTNGKPCMLKDGFSIMKMKYDEMGNLLETAYFDVDDKPCLHNDGNFKVIYEYDSRGKYTEITYYNTKNNLCLINDGYAKCTFKYNEQGKETECCFYGTDGKPYIINKGYAKFTYIYDEQGNIIETSHYDTDGKLCLCANGYAKSTYSYDQRGNVIEFTFYGMDNQLCMMNHGCAKYVYAYDEKGNRIETIAYNAENHLCMTVTNVCKIVQTYDVKGNLISIINKDTADNICNNIYGYAQHDMIYNDRRELIEELYIDNEGNVIIDRLNTVIVNLTIGAAQQQGIPLYSLAIKWNDWVVGESKEKLELIIKQGRDKEKEVYFLAPNGEIHRLYVKDGILGVGYQPYFIDKSKAIEALKLIKQ